MTISELRKMKKLTQQQVAERLNVSQSAVAMWETGKAAPSFKLLVLLAEIFSVTVDELCAALNEAREKAK